MREIRFRCWDKKDEVMFYSRKDNFTFIEADRSDKKYGVVMKGVLSAAIDNKMPIMQFTGLKDRNGREIYEGDIYRVDAEDALCGTYPVVVDETHGMRFMLGKSIVCKADAIYGEVIGNVYENPEMVKP